MRVKIFLLRGKGITNTVPLHHQLLILEFLEDLMRDMPIKTEQFSFSSLKGTSKIQNGFIRFLSSKVTLALSSNNAEFLEMLVQKIFEHPSINIGKLNLIPKMHQVMDEPEFKTQMKYVCISPLIVVDPQKDPELCLTQIDPSSHEFSDLLYHSTIENMEKAGFSDEELNSFAEFEATPDLAYVQKINESGKKYARFYKNINGDTMLGYLLPFTLHAHPTVHKFIWDCGLGLYTNQGYGMIDVVQEY